MRESGVHHQRSRSSVHTPKDTANTASAGSSARRCGGEASETVASTSPAKTSRRIVGQAESALRSGLGAIFAVAEAYPDLKTNDTFQHLLSRISGLENAVADRREFYNESVNLYNVRLEQFPDVLIAGMFHFTPRSLLEFSDEEKRDVDIKQLFSA